MHLAEQVVQHVAPVAHHVQDHAAAVFRAVVPARALDRLQVAFEHPVAELEAHATACGRRSRRGAACRACAGRAGTACPAPRRASGPSPAPAWRSRPPRSGWWRSASRSRRACRRAAPWPAGSGASAWCRRRRRPCRPCWPAPRRGRCPSARCRGRVASASIFSALRPIRIGSGITLSPLESVTPPCVADRDDGADQVLVHAHASGDAVHDDSESLCAHGREGFPCGR